MAKIKVIKCGFNKINSGTSISIDLWFKNISGKTIKYIEMRFDPLNRVRDIVDTDFKCHKFTGPYESEVVYRCKFTKEFVLNGGYFETLSLIGFEITYMDGTQEMLLSSHEGDIIFDYEEGEKLEKRENLETNIAISIPLLIFVLIVAFIIYKLSSLF